VHLRPITPDDADRLVAFHGRLSGQTIHYRFFTPRPRLRPAEVARFTTVDHHDRVSLVATLNDELVAVARYDRLPGTDQAEVAFVVEDQHQGRGLGTILLEHLASAARERGISTFVATVLPDNWRMLSVFKSAGWATTNHLTGGVIGVEFDIAPTEGALVARHAREHQAEARSVARLLHPTSVAVIGAGRSATSYGHVLLRNIVRGGFTGALHVVHPTATTVAGVPAVPSVDDIAGPVDLAVIVVPEAAVQEVVEACARKGVRGLLVVSSGYADAGAEGLADEHALIAAAHEAGMRVVGPNSPGLVNTHPDVRLHAVLGPEEVRSGGLGILSQSGGLGMGLLRWASRPGLGVSSFVAVGNKADVSGNDILQFWADDERTTVIGLYLESFGNPRKFARVARRVARSKPVLAVKSGRRDGSDVAVDALFAQAGVLRVGSVSGMLDAAALLANQPLPRGRRVRVIAGPGSPVLLAVDGLDAAGLSVADVVSVPLSEPGPYADAVRSAVGIADAVLALYTPPLDAGGEDVARALAGAGAEVDLPVAAVVLEWEAALVATGGQLPVYGSPETAAAALGLAADYADWLAAAVDDPALVPAVEGAVRAVVEREGPLDEAAVLASVGIDLVELPSAEAPGGAVELVVGMRPDPTFGPVVTVAVGGPAAALVDDRRARITPLTAADAAALVRSLRTAPVLFAGLSTAPLEDLLLRVGLLVEAAPEIASLSLAPVWLGPHGVTVGGASVERQETTPRSDDRRRLTERG
jgi:acyl-CoA synthetase (NDP forming)/GNAT superfamily N-acetyltransferase